MTSRKAKVLYKDVDQAQYEEAMAAYAKANAEADNLTSKMDLAIAKIREKNADQLNKLVEEQNENFAIIQSYCEEHPELFDTKKSLITIHGTIGFRSGTPKIKLTRGTWAIAQEKIKTHLPDYIRTKEEPAKDQLLADREKEGMAEKFKLCNLKVDNNESFFITLKKEDAEAAV